MEVIAFVRILRRRRIAIAIGAVLAVAVGITVGKSPVPNSGLAKTEVIVDTAQSQLTASDPPGAGTLSWRATVMGMLLRSDQAVAQIARETNVPPGQVGVTDLELTSPVTVAPLPAAAVPTANNPAPYQLTVHTDDILPIIWVQAKAPDRAGAARLAQAAVHALQAGISPKTTNQLQGLKVQQVSPIVAREIPGGPGRRKMALIAGVFFVLWCLCATLGPALLRARRTSSAADASELLGW